MGTLNRYNETGVFVMLRKRGIFLSFALMMMMLFFIKSDVLAANVVEKKTEGTITWTFYDDGRLIVSGTGELSYENCTYRNYNSLITNVTIENGITSLGWDAFYHFRNLKSVSIPGSVLTISGDAFRDCEKLTDISFSAGLTSIGAWAFAGCTSIKDITIPDSVNAIYNSAFRDCNSLVSVTIPNSVTTIDSWAFWGCSSLNNVSVPNTFMDNANIKRLFTGTPWGLNKLGPIGGAVGDFMFSLDKDGSLTLSGQGTITFRNVDESELYNYKQLIKTVVVSESTTKLESSQWDSMFPNIEKIINRSNIKIWLTQYDDNISWCNETDLNERIFWLPKGTAVKLNKKVGMHVKVLFDGNGATSGSMKPITVKVDEYFTVPDCEFEKKGYELREWKCNVGNAYMEFVDGAKIRIESGFLRWHKSDTVTIVADWKAVNTKIGLSKTSVSVKEDKSTVVYLPAKTKATVKSISNKIATVKYNKNTGRITITGKSAGYTNVTVKVGKVTERIYVTVKATPFEISPTSVTIGYNKKTTVTAPKKKNIKVSSSNNKIATAKYNKSNGKITISGKAKGTADIIVNLGDITNKVHVNVEATTTKLKISKKSVTLAKVGKTATLKITATPKKSITNELASVSVDKQDIVSTKYISKSDKIIVTSKKSGTATITIKVGKKVATVKVTVK